MSTIFLYHHKIAPYACLCLAKLCDVQCERIDPGAVNTIKVPKSVSDGGVALVRDDNKVIVSDEYSIVRCLARMSINKNDYGLWYNDKYPVISSQIDHFIDYSRIFLSSRTDELQESLKVLDKHLSIQSYIVRIDTKYVHTESDQFITLADVVAYTTLSRNMRAIMLMKKQFPNINRWMKTIKSSSVFGNIVEEYEELKKKSKLETSKGGSFDIRLPNAIMGGVVTRFPPEPSGYMHIGHVKAVLLNDYFAKKYKGKMILRFDDTNPTKEKQEYIDSIQSDMKLLGVEWAELTHTSDHFEFLLATAEQLLKDNKVYIDDTPVEQMREEKKAGIPPKTRDRPVEESMKLWNEMKLGTEIGKKCCMRGKLNCDSANKTLFDPVFYRCNDIPHVRSGTKYKVYPTYDYACPLVDSREGVTHTLRTSEYHDRDEQYMMILDIVNMRKPNIWEYSRINFKYTLLSKRKLNWFVDEGKVEGWNDPRFPTVQGVLRRGMTVPALREFILLQGASKAVNMMSWNKIWAINKKVLDNTSVRVNCISNNNSVKVQILGFGDSAGMKKVNLHPKKPEMGSKDLILCDSITIEQEDAVMLEINEEITLMNWGNAIVKNIEKDNNNTVTKVTMELALQGDVKSTKKKLTWLSNEEEFIPVRVQEFDYLIDVPKLEEDMELMDHLVDITMEETLFNGENYMKNIKKNDIIQINRRGFYRCDVAYDKDSNTKMLLFAIPDSKDSNASVLTNKIQRRGD